MGICDPFPEVKRGRGVTLTTSPSAEVKNDYELLSPRRLYDGSGADVL
jgi:hypothetical protein